MAEYFKTLKESKENARSKKILINARILDPETGYDKKGEIIIEGDKITDFGPGLLKTIDQDEYEVIDCNNNLVTPGLIDLQVHFRDPGFLNKETLATGSKSSVAGGITSVVCQPNTNPVIDDVTTLEYIKYKALNEAYCNVFCYGSITKGMKGEEISEMGLLTEAGAVGFTDDGLPIMNAHIMRRALEYAKDHDAVVAQHAEDLNLSNGGCINEGKISQTLGVNGIPNISESTIVARDIAIVRITGGRYHVLHVSTKEALEHIRQAKQEGLSITCEAAPHHFTLTDSAVEGYNTNAKMNPPLRSEADRQAVIAGLSDGTIDAIATDHAPHDIASKSRSLSEAAFGIVGVETMLPLSLELYFNGNLSLKDLFAKMTYQASDIIKINRGRIKKGWVADLTVIDLEKEWQIDVNKFYSKSKNSPFDKRKVKGKAVKTIIAGEVVFSA